MDSLTELFCLIDDFCQSFESDGETSAGAGPEEAPAAHIAESVGADDTGRTVSPAALPAVQEFLSFPCATVSAVEFPGLPVALITRTFFHSPNVCRD